MMTFEEPNTHDDDMTEMAAYFLKPYRVECRCGRWDEMPEAELKDAGWRLSPLKDDTELCPSCAMQEELWQAGVQFGRFQKAMENYDQAVSVLTRQREAWSAEIPF